MSIWVALKENARLARILWVITNMCLPETKATGTLGAETICSWCFDMEGHAKKCVERYCELANKTNRQLYHVATPCLDDHQFKEEEIGSVGDLSTVCSHVVLKCLYLARSGRSDT